MAKGKSTWKYNKLLTGRRNYFTNGSLLPPATIPTNTIKDFNLNIIPNSLGSSVSPIKSISSGLTGMLKENPLAQGLVGAGIQTANILLGDAIGGGYSSGVGDTFNAAGLGILGGITNRMFGSKMNNENIAKVEGNINELNNFTSNASNYDSLSQNWANAATGMTFNNSFIGKDGWFSNKAKNKAADLRRQIATGNEWVQNTLNNNANNIGITQIQNLLGNYAALGGNLMTHGSDFNTKLNIIGNGGLHSENPYGGVPMGVDSQGIPNLVEEDEVIFNDYVFSNRLKVPKAVRNKYKLRGNKPLTFAEAAIQMGKESEERPNDPISQLGLQDSMAKLIAEQEQIRMKKEKIPAEQFAKGGKMGRKYAGDGPNPQLLDLGMGPIAPIPSWITETPVRSVKIPNEKGIIIGGYTSNPTIIEPKESTIENITNTKISPAIKANIPTNTATRTTRDIDLAPTWMRYAPAVASGIMSITDAMGLTNKPDYSEANAVLDAAKVAGNYTPVRYNPIGNYLTYRPFDRDYYINKINAEASAARRNIMNTSGGNRATAMAGLLTADYNTQDKMGDLFRKAEEYNLAQREKVEDFNRATNINNSDNMLKADLANMEAQLNSGSSYFKGALAASELRQKERLASTASRSANLSNFINSLGDIGRENFERNMITTDPSKYYSLGPNGRVTYNGAFDRLPPDMQSLVIASATAASNAANKSKAKGGYLTIKKKKYGKL